MLERCLLHVCKEAGGNEHIVVVVVVVVAVSTCLSCLSVCQFQLTTVGFTGFGLHTLVS